MLRILSFENAEALGSRPLCVCRRLHYTLFQKAHLLPSCLAVSCLSHCPHETTSLAAPQDLHPPKPYSHSMAV